MSPSREEWNKSMRDQVVKQRAADETKPSDTFWGMYTTIEKARTYAKIGEVFMVHFNFEECILSKQHGKEFVPMRLSLGWKNMEGELQIIPWEFSNPQAGGDILEAITFQIAKILCCADCIAKIKNVCPNIDPEKN